MLRKISILSIVLLTMQISQSLQYQTSGSKLLCLGNKTVKVIVTTDPLLVQVSELTNPEFGYDYVSARVAGSRLGWYKLHTQAETWNEARKICEEEQAHLSIINSDIERRVILELVNRSKGNFSNAIRNDYIWLGAHNMFANDDWTTILGEPMSSVDGYVKWSMGCEGYLREPNNDEGNEHCLSLGLECDQSFNDYNCDLRLAFVCEKSDECQQHVNTNVKQ